MFGALFFKERHYMFKNNSVKFLLFVFAASLFFACSGNHQKQTQNQEEGFVDPRENTHMQRTKTDTLAVLYNVKKYLDFLKENQTDSAMAMLYEQIGDNEPIALNDSRKDEILKQLVEFDLILNKMIKLRLVEHLYQAVIDAAGHIGLPLFFGQQVEFAEFIVIIAGSVKHTAADDIKKEKSIGLSGFFMQFFDGPEHAFIV